MQASSCHSPLMQNKLQSQTDAGNAQRFDGVYDAIEEIQRLVQWLGYIREEEFTDLEAKRLIDYAQRFVKVAQPIANKYLD
jgi:hypothetical protein